MSSNNLKTTKRHALTITPQFMSIEMHKFLRSSVCKLKHLTPGKVNSENVANFEKILAVSYSTSKKRNTTVNKMVNFDEMVAERRMQAQKSILVQVNSEKSFSELHTYCSQYGTIIGGHHYKFKDVNYILVEYSNKQEAKIAIEHCTHNDTTRSYVESQFLWFRAAQKGSVMEKRIDSGKLQIIDGCQPIDYSIIDQILLNAESVSDQMLVLYNATVLNDLSIRLRFFAAQQVEQSTSRIFPSAEACLFGSSVNGYGKIGCDLDLILRLSSREQEFDPANRLVFHVKENDTSPRLQTQRYLENFSETMHSSMPGVYKIQKILQARVPIIRYHHDHLNLEVDLSMSSMSGVYMSELLYMFGQIDERVAPLVFSIRRWAQCNGLTDPSPGPWITNFSLTCLVIFYLQQLNQPVLPPINSFVEQARSKDKQLVDDGITFGYLRDLNSLKFSKQNKNTLEQLFVGFFEFYSQMNFSENSISLNDAKLHLRAYESGIHIINPIEPTLNVSKNINHQQCERFLTEIQNAALVLESGHKRDRDKAWGLLKLFSSHKQPVYKSHMFFETRKVEVSDLFDDTADATNHSVKKHQNIKFKNNSVKNEVTKIKRRGRIELNAMNSKGKKT